MLVEDLREQWRMRSATKRVHDVLSFKNGELTLGAGTVLARAAHGPSAIGLEDDDRRLEALLSVAFQRPVEKSALAHVRAATRRWHQGDAAQARLHLALSRLGRLQQPVDAARRLFMADGLIDLGVAPEEILKALGLAPHDHTGTRKYSPNQPRVPAGSGRASGEWTNGGGAQSGGTQTAGGQTAEIAHSPNAKPARPNPRPGQAAKPQAPKPVQVIPPANRPTRLTASTSGAGLVAPVATSVRPAAGLDLNALSGRRLAALTDFIAGLSETVGFTTTLAAGGTVATLGVLLIPSSGPKGEWVKVGGPGNISYFHNPDELKILFRYTSADGIQHTVAAFPDPDGNYKGPDGKTIARWVKTGAKAALVVSTAALMGRDTDQPQICPAPAKDRNTTALGRAFEDYMKPRFNPGNPTPSGFAYFVLDKSTGNMVAIDDCQHKLGAWGEYKGPGYEKHYLKDDGPWHGMYSKIMKQSLAQAKVSGNRPIIWFFAEKSMADYFRTQFSGSIRAKIHVEWVPLPENAK